MTRDEALTRVTKAHGGTSLSAIEIVDALVALDLLHLEEPRGIAADLKAHEVLQNVMTEMLVPRNGTNAREVGCLSSYGAGCIRQALDTAGLTIVRKEDLK